MANTINPINRIIAERGCGNWEQEHQTTLYLSHNQRARQGYDCMTYYRGGYGYPEICFVKEALEGNNYGTTTRRVAYATAKEFLTLLKTQKYEGGMWRSQI